MRNPGHSNYGVCLLGASRIARRGSRYAAGAAVFECGLPYLSGHSSSTHPFAKAGYHEETVMLWVLALVAIAIALVVAVATWFWRSVKTLKCKGGVIYYRSTVTADEAQRLGEFLERADFFNRTQSAVELEKE